MEISEPIVKRRSRWQALRYNPVTMKELRSRMRGRRAFVVLTVYLLVMSLFISLVYLAYAAAAAEPYGPDVREAGKVVFGAVMGIEVFVVIFVAPSFTAGAISGEKERQTFDLLRTTLLSANDFVTGKLISALSYIFLLIFASIPLQSIAFLLGGLSVEELVVGQLIILVASITFALFGLFCSSVMRSTLAASVVTFAGSLFWTVGLPLLILFFMGFIGPILFGLNSLTWVGEALLAYGAILLVGANLPATLIGSEVILLEFNAIFFFDETFGGYTLWFPSPWIIFLLFYMVLSFLLYWLCVRRVRRIATK